MSKPTPPPGFDFLQPPFDLLAPHEQARLARALDLRLFARGEQIIEAGASLRFVYVILRGEVVASDLDDHGESHFGDYGDGDLFGAFAVISGRARHRYRATEDSLCFSIPDTVFKQLIEANHRFAAYFLEAMSVKKRLLRERDQPSDLAEVMLSRIRDGLVIKPVLVDPQSSIQQTVHAMRQQRVDNVLVPLNDQANPMDSDIALEATQLGIVTRTDLLDALAVYGSLPSDRVLGLARSPLIAVDEQALLFEALVTMTARRIHRVAVTRGGMVVGTLGLMEVLSHFSAKSHVINFRLEQARDIADLVAIARELNALVRTLFAQGAKIRFLMDLISALNTRMMSKVYELLLPQGFPPPSLLALGSEGRHEQILKTDQDNAMILPKLSTDAPFDVEPFALGLSDALERLGFPLCPGGVMVRNPAWRHSLDGWLQTVRGWVQKPDHEALMHMAMLFDASVVAGPHEPLSPLRHAMFGLGQNAASLRRFAEPAVQFRTPLTLFGGLKGDPDGIELKKGGIFPIVHGVRALALRERVEPTNTFARVDALVEAGTMHAAFAQDLKQSLSVLLRLRLAEQLACMARGEPISNRLQPKKLRRLDLDLLRDALRLVREFQAMLKQEFKLE